MSATPEYFPRQHHIISPVRESTPINFTFIPIAQSYSDTSPKSHTLHHIVFHPKNSIVILRHSYHHFRFAIFSLWSRYSVTNFSFETDSTHYQIYYFFPSSTPSTYTTLSYLLHHLQLLKNIKTASNPDVNPDLNPDEIPDVNPDVNPDANPDANRDLNLDVKPAVKPNLNLSVKPDLTPIVKPELLPIASLDAGYQRQTKYSLETFLSLLPFPITNLSCNFHCITGIALLTILICTIATLHGLNPFSLLFS